MTEDDIWKSVPLTTNPGYATPLLPKWLDPADGIAVYTDVVRGNPLRAKRVVRWVLFFPGGISGAPAASEYSADDLIACYTAAYCREFSWRPTVPLAVVDLYLDYYRDLPRPPGGRRNGTLWYSKKLSYTVGGKRLERPEPDLSGKDVLDYSVTKRARLERFATAALFVSYDPATYRSVEAALAGCPSVVVPFPGLDRATYVRDFGRFIGRGVGYGLEEGGRSMETMGGVIDEARESLAKQREDVDGFVAAVLDRWFPGAAGDPEMARFAREADPRAEMQLVRMRARQKEGHAP
ncbi:hypothetical protein DFJ74DRAFT_685698 [Hyaloraphidium curvatum]|nr:hypothetical protein DFJ74DRAFT_685698 [Hyaloraphidium curvatum]